VTHVSTSKASHCVDVSLRPTAALSSLWWGPKLGTLPTSTVDQKKSALPMKRHLHTCQNCINKEASASFRHTLTCSSRSKFGAAVGEGRRERERERGAFLG